MPKLTLEERRLQTLRSQLHGKSQIQSKPEKQTHSTFSFQANQPSPAASKSDTLYLKKDLLKILILGTLAIALQICLYSLEAKHLISLHF